MLLTLRQNFDSYLSTLSDQGQRQAIELADLIEDVGHKCQDVQDALTSQDYSPVNTPVDQEYQHVISVNTLSGGKAIMDEYRSLKVKFDKAVSELNNVKRQLKLHSSTDVQSNNDGKLREQIATLEGTYGQKLEALLARVDELSFNIVSFPTSNSPSKKVATTDSLSFNDIGKQLQVLESSLTSLEKQAASNSKIEMDGQNVGLQLEPIRLHLEDASKELNSFRDALKQSSVDDTSSKIESCKEKLGSLFKTLNTNKVSCENSENLSENSLAATAGFTSCLLDVKQRVQEIGEQLDSLEEDGEDSDSEDEGDEEQTTVESIREKLCSLTEYIEQHSKLSGSDWELLRLMSLQKSSSTITKDETDTKTASDEDKLKLYANRLSLEAVILSEMGHLLQNKDHLVHQDSVCRHIDSLSNQLLSLQHLLDSEMKTMHFDEPQADLLSSYAELLSEKILINTQLNSVEQDSQAAGDSSFQPVLLATEAILRSQVDSSIVSNMDHSVEDILVMPTYLTSRSIIQGEVTHAITSLKDRLQQKPEVLEPGLPCYQLMLERVIDRQNKVISSFEAYEKQVIHSLAVIIFKESEEMTIIEGPESILEAMCSELSTIMETYIQRYKEKCRAAMDTHSAHKHDVIVNELRSVRENMLVKLKNQHEAYAQDPGSARDSSLDIPVQSLDDTISNFGEILSLKAIVKGTSNFLIELLKMGSSVLEDLVLEPDMNNEDNQNYSVEKGLNSFVLALSQGLQSEAVSKEKMSRRVLSPSDQTSDVAEDSVEDIVLKIPDLSDLSDQMGGRAASLVREAVFNAQLTFTLFKQKMMFSREISQLRARRPVRVRPEMNPEESHDSDDTLDLQTDFQVSKSFCVQSHYFHYTSRWFAMF